MRVRKKFETLGDLVLVTNLTKTTIEVEGDNGLVYYISNVDDIAGLDERYFRRRVWVKEVCPPSSGYKQLIRVGLELDDD